MFYFITLKRTCAKMNTWRASAKCVCVVSIKKKKKKLFPSRNSAEKCDESMKTHSSHHESLPGLLCLQERNIQAHSQRGIARFRLSLGENNRMGRGVVLSRPTAQILGEFTQRHVYDNVLTMFQLKKKRKASYANETRNYA